MSTKIQILVVILTAWSCKPRVDRSDAVAKDVGVTTSDAGLVLLYFDDGQNLDEAFDPDAKSKLVMASCPNRAPATRKTCNQNAIYGYTEEDPDLWEWEEGVPAFKKMFLALPDSLGVEINKTRQDRDRLEEAFAVGSGLQEQRNDLNARLEQSRQSYSTATAELAEVELVLAQVVADLRDTVTPELSQRHIDLQRRAQEIRGRVEQIQRDLSETTEALTRVNREISELPADDPEQLRGEMTRLGEKLAKLQSDLTDAQAAAAVADVVINNLVHSDIYSAQENSDEFLALRSFTRSLREIAQRCFFRGYSEECGSHFRWERADRMLASGEPPYDDLSESLEVAHGSMSLTRTNGNRYLLQSSPGSIAWYKHNPVPLTDKDMSRVALHMVPNGWGVVFGGDEGSGYHVVRRVDCADAVDEGYGTWCANLIFEFHNQGERRDFSRFEYRGQFGVRRYENSVDELHVERQGDTLRIRDDNGAILFATRHPELRGPRFGIWGDGSTGEPAGHTVDAFRILAGGTRPQFRGGEYVSEHLPGCEIKVDFQYSDAMLSGATVERKACDRSSHNVQVSCSCDGVDTCWCHYKEGEQIKTWLPMGIVNDDLIQVYKFRHGRGFEYRSTMVRKAL